MKIGYVVFAIAVGAAVGCKSEDQGSKPQVDKTPQAVDKTPQPADKTPQPADKAVQAAAAPTAPAAPAGAGGGKEIFATRCTPCHGTSGKGDGAAAVALNPKPRDYTNKEWQASITDEQLKKVIVGGGASVGKSAAMPPNPDLKDKPELDELVKVVRSFGR